MKTCTLSNKIFDACMDVKTDGHRLFAIQRNDQHPNGRLCVLDRKGVLLGEYIGLGTARQIEIKNHIAVVTARANNLFIFDVSENTPKLLSHYKTIEYAVGVALYGNLAFISCRQYGIEVIDLQDPCHPRHVRTIQTGEVQSACVSDGILYGGIWGTMKVLVIDIRDLDHPQVLAEIPLQGRGDGVIVKDHLLYAVTGQHKRGIINDQDHDDPCFGKGNGVEIYDVSDPSKPRFLKRQEFCFGYSRNMDMWDANVAGDLLLCNDSICGVYGYHATTFEPIFHLTFHSNQIAATGLTTFDGNLYVSSTDGLYRFSEYAFDNLHHADTTEVLSGKLDCFTSDSDRLVPRFSGDFPVISVCETDDGYAVACGNDGIRLLDQEFHPILHHAIDGMCCEVKVNGSRIYAAMAENGLQIFERNGNQLQLVSQYIFEEPLLQIDLSRNGNYLNCFCGERYITLMDVQDTNNLHPLSRRDREVGNIYGANYLTGRLHDGSMGMFWHHDGLFLTNPEHGEADYRRYYYKRKISFMGFGPETGCDTDGERIFFTLSGGIITLPLSSGYVDDLPLYKADHIIEGKITYHKDILYAAQRAKGLIQVYDIHDLNNIKTLQYIHTNASCEKPVIIRGRVLFPGWYGGLLELI